MKCDNIMAERLFDTQIRFDSSHPEAKCKQNMKRCLTVLSHHETHESVIKQNDTNTKEYENNSKPDKYRIDFLILANASSGHSFIYHIDVYRGKMNKILEYQKIFQSF